MDMRAGNPEVVLTDNGRQFVSEMYENFPRELNTEELAHITQNQIESQRDWTKWSLNLNN